MPCLQVSALVDMESVAEMEEEDIEELAEALRGQLLAPPEEDAARHWVPLPLPLPLARHCRKNENGCFVVFSTGL